METRTDKGAVRTALLGSLVLLATLFPASVAEPTAAAAPTAAQEPTPTPAMLRFFNRDIITFRAAYFGFQPAARATNGAERIREALATGGPGVVAMSRTSEGLEVSVDGRYVFRILEPDLDADDGETFDEARVVVAGRLEEAIAAARQTLRGEGLFRAVGLSVGATLVLGLTVWALGRGRLWLRKWLGAWLARRLRLGEHEHGRLLRVLWGFGQPVFLLVVAVLVEEWLRFVFNLFPYTRPWATQLTRYIANLIGQVLEAIISAVPGLMMVAVIALLAYLVIQVVRTFAGGIERGRYQLLGIDADVVHPTRRLLTAAIWLFALAMAYPYLPGSSSEAFKGLTVLVGLMVSLGASGIVGQAAGGFILTFSRTLRDGEWVRIGEVEGAVINVGTFATKIRTLTDEEISIPNTVVLGTITRNYSRPAVGEASLLETSVTIGYNAPWRQVHAMLQEAAARTPELEREPAPQVLQMALSDFYVRYSLRARLQNPSRRAAAASALNGHIQDVFNEYGVQIMSPHYLSDPAAPVVVPRERWYEPPAPAPPVGAPSGPARTAPDGSSSGTAGHTRPRKE